MELLKLSLKLFATHATMSIIQITLMFPLLGVLQDNRLYQWSVGLLFIGIFWFIVYARMSSEGLEDARLDRYKSKKGFLAGAICTIPGIILYLATLLYSPGANQVNWFEVVMRIWLSPYIKILTSFEKQMPHLALLVNMLLPIVSGISYMDGRRKRQKILDTIKESDKLRAQKSKIGYDR